MPLDSKSNLEFSELFQPLIYQRLSGEEIQSSIKEIMKMKKIHFYPYRQIRKRKLGRNGSTTAKTNSDP